MSITKRMSAWLTLLFLASISAETGLQQEIELDKGVMVVTNENYEAVVSNSPLLMIYFYDQKCTDCHKMDIEFATAAWMIRETETIKQKVDFAKVDATLPSQLAIKHDVKRFPTLILIKAIISLDALELFNIFIWSLSSISTCCRESQMML